MKIFLYFLHNVISKIGNKITSIAILFILISKFQKNSLSISILLFSIDPIINILFSNIYSKIIDRYKNFKILVFLDFLSSILVFLVFLFNNNVILMILFYFLLSIIVNLTIRYNRGLFFVLTKNSKNEENYYKINSRIKTILSIISPAISSFIISKFGNEKSFLFDSFSFFIGSVIFLIICDKLKNLNANKNDENNEVSNNKINYKFTNMLNKCSNDFKFICIVFIAVAFITNFEEPLIFNYLSLNRNFSKELIGISLSIFSIGMFLGSFIYDYLPKTSNGMFIAVILDGIFSFLLSMNINRYLIIFFYMCQGIMAVMIMIHFNVSIQKEFETSDYFMQFQNQLDKILSIFILFSYIVGLVISNFITDSSLFFKILAILEILTTIICLSYKKYLIK